jgi:hypothetical protein
MEPAKEGRHHHDGSLGCRHGLYRKPKSGKAMHRTILDQIGEHC